MVQNVIASVIVMLTMLTIFMVTFGVCYQLIGNPVNNKDAFMIVGVLALVGGAALGRVVVRRWFVSYLQRQTNQQ